MAEKKIEIKNGMRDFGTGATRNVDTNKYDYEAFLSPLVVEAYGAYMNENRHLPDGTLRDGDNWQKGIPLNQYMKSGWRHFFDWWSWHRGFKEKAKEGIVYALCGVIFNASGYLHEILKENPGLLDEGIKEHKVRKEKLTAKKS